ncbi:WD40 repeat-like protein [Meira miltonrushii]|uniref:WD40 repeat-like protein n=1 Tax=Meira miltonrushii TaxID=1280837 RepID=A0A316VDV8_9BASI|nr:WD40 repeat-like protein [Meira miltonrushii]PWN35762.1 WD40 repeat-like protein [Meira miltonrushii]
MSLQYLADIESTDGPNEGDDISALHWLEDGVILGGTVKGHLYGWRDTNGQYLGEAGKGGHGICINSISSSRQNKVVLTAALDGTVALWDTSDIAAMLQRSEVIPTGENEESSLSQQPDTFPLTLLKSMRLNKKSSAESQSMNEVSVGNEAQNPRPMDSKRTYCAVLHPTEPIFMTTGSKAELIIRSYDRDSRQFGQVITSISPDGTEKNGKFQESSSGSKVKDFGLCLLVHNSGETVALGTSEGYVHLFQIEEKKHLISIKASGQAVKCLHFTPNDELLVGGNDGNVSVFDVQQYVPKSSSRVTETEDEDLFVDGLDEFADDFTFSQHSIHTMSQTSSNSSLFSQTQPSRSTSLKPVRSWSSHPRGLTGVKASSDGRIVATSSIDGRVRIWDFKNPATQALCNIKQDKDIYAIEWKPVARDEADDRNATQERPSKRCKTVPISNSAMTAAAQSAKTASMFVTAGADGKVRWYRMAGGNTANV